MFWGDQGEVQSWVAERGRDGKKCGVLPCFSGELSATPQGAYCPRKRPPKDGRTGECFCDVYFEPTSDLRPAVGPSNGLFAGRFAEPLGNPARPHWPFPTVHATQAQNQTEDRHEPTFLFIENSQTFPQPKPVAKLQLTL